MVNKYFPQYARSLRLKETARAYFKEPIGTLLSPNDKTAEEKFLERYGNITQKGGLLIAVGDVVAKSLLSIGIIPNVTIIDFKTLRENNLQVTIPNAQKINVDNPATEITREAWKTIKDLFKSLKSNKRRFCLQVKGEEDLLAIPVVLEAPLNSFMVYGQPGEGIVVAQITKPLKTTIEKLLIHFVPFS